MLASALIPARGGSKGIPKKNLRPFCGRPLLSWAIQVALETCSEVYVSTEDDDIAALARDAGAMVIHRPRELAADDTPMLPVVQHALSQMDPITDVLVLLQPTQPLREAKHILQACRVLEDTGVDSVVSVVQVPAHYSPDYVMRLEDGELHPYMTKVVEPTRRQQAAPAYSRDGTVYVVRRRIILSGSLYGSHCRPLIMQPSESANIDTESDWQWAEYMRSKNG